MFTDVHVDLQSRKKIQGYTVNVWFTSILWTVMKIASLQAVHNVFMNTFKCSGKNPTDRSISFCWTKKKLLIWTLAYITEEEKKVEKHTRSVTIGSSAHNLINIESSHQFDWITSTQLVQLVRIWLCTMMGW